MLCEHALEAYAHHGTVSSGDTLKQRGLIVNYDSLPGIVPKVVLPLFGVVVTESWVSKMIEESGQYSKARSNAREFTGDSEDKDSRATEDITKWSNVILSPSYEKLAGLSDESAAKVLETNPRFTFPLAPDSVEAGEPHFDWEIVKEMPPPSLFQSDPEKLGATEGGSSGEGSESERSGNNGNEGEGNIELGGLAPPIESNSIALGGPGSRLVNIHLPSHEDLGDARNSRDASTGRIEVGMFANNVNSARFEVYKYIY